MKISTIAGILGIIISLGTIGGVYVSLHSRVCVLEEQYDTKTETDDAKFLRIDKVVTDNTQVITKLLMATTKLNTTLDIIIKMDHKELQDEGTTK